VWKISRAQVYRFLDCAHVLSLLADFAIQPSHERLCRSLKRLAKTDSDIVALWQACLSKVNTKDEVLAYDLITSSFVTKVWESMREESTSETVQESEEEVKKSKKRPMVVASPAWNLSSSLPNESIHNIDIPRRPSSANYKDDEWQSHQLREMEQFVGVAPSSPPTSDQRTRLATESGGYSGSDESDSHYDLFNTLQNLPTVSGTTSVASEEFHPYHGGLCHFAHYNQPPFAQSHVQGHQVYREHLREHCHLYSPYARSVSPRTASPLAYYTTEPIYSYSPTFSHAISMDRLNLDSPNLLGSPKLPAVQAPTPQRPVLFTQNVDPHAPQVDPYYMPQPHMPPSMTRPKSALDDLVEVAIQEAAKEKLRDETTRV